MNTPITMTTHAENYLRERRRLGFGLRSPGYAIISFAHYIDTLEHPRTADRRDDGRLGTTRPRA